MARDRVRRTGQVDSREPREVLERAGRLHDDSDRARRAAREGRLPHQLAEQLDSVSREAPAGVRGRVSGGVSRAMCQVQHLSAQLRLQLPRAGRIRCQWLHEL